MMLDNVDAVDAVEDSLTVTLVDGTVKTISISESDIIMQVCSQQVSNGYDMKSLLSDLPLDDFNVFGAVINKQYILNEIDIAMDRLRGVKSKFEPAVAMAKENRDVKLKDGGKLIAG